MSPAMTPGLPVATTRPTRPRHYPRRLRRARGMANMHRIYTLSRAWTIQLTAEMEEAMRP